MLILEQLIQSKRILMCGGKGGVGKTTLSCVIALKAVQLKLKVLLISTDPAHSLSDAFAIKIGSKKKTLVPNLDVLELDPDTEVDHYLARVLDQMRQYVGPDKVQELERQLRLTRHSPGAQEAALLERVSQLIDEGVQSYDLVIFDTAPTGHTLRLLSLPEVMAVWTEGLLKHNQRSQHLSSVLAHLTPGRDLNNPIAAQDNAIDGLDEKQQRLLSTLQKRQSLFHRARDLLTDRSSSGFLFVLTPERLPILETQRAVSSLQESHIPVAGLLVNRVLADKDATTSFWQSRLAQQTDYLQQIEHLFKAIPKQFLALQENDINGISELEKITYALK